MQNDTLEVKNDSLLLTVEDAARLLRISRRTLLRMNSSGKIPAPVRLGRCCRWRRAELEQWLAAGLPSRQKWLAILSNPKGIGLN